DRRELKTGQIGSIPGQKEHRLHAAKHAVDRSRLRQVGLGPADSGERTRPLWSARHCDSGDASRGKDRDEFAADVASRSEHQYQRTSATRNLFDNGEHQTFMPPSTTISMPVT